MPRSHITQQLLNYFDETDTRVRETANTIDAQLLNTAAVSLEEHELRVCREIGGRFLATCPLNLDNGGVYYRVQIPVSFHLTSDAEGNLLPPAKVTGKLGDALTVLASFEDMLLPPAAVEHAGDPVPCANPKLATIAGQAIDGTPTIIPQVSPGVLPVPNRISFWVQGLQELQNAVVIVVEGQPHPQALWPGLASSKAETLIVTSEGLHRTNTAWFAIDKITVYGLPLSGTVDVYALEMCLPFTPDAARPYTAPDTRGVLFNRYWQLDLDPDDNEHRLNEVYYKNTEIGFPVPADLAPPPLVASYRMDPPLTAIAVEPNTWGMIAVRESRTGEIALDYMDRRETLPAKLDRAALTAEPYYGLNVLFDERTRAERRVLLQTMPYTRADQVMAWRYVVEVPGVEDKYLLTLADRIWSLGDYLPGLWNSGKPPEELAFALSAGAGTYVFTLETRTGAGVLGHDSYPFADLAVTPAVSLALDLVSTRGIAFDYRQRLWIWDGLLLHPMRLVYEGYMFDPVSRSLYLTRPYDEVTVQ